jgi:hypothetical protein
VHALAINALIGEQPAVISEVTWLLAKLIASNGIMHIDLQNSTQQLAGCVP